MADEDIQIVEEDEQEDSASPSRTTVLIIAAGALIVLGGIFVRYTLDLNTKPEKECTYRGGVWESAKEECVYENGVGGIEQVGMEIVAVSLQVPSSKETVFFDSIEVGAEKVYTASFASGVSNGLVSMNATLAKVHKNTKNLVIPFTVRFEEKRNLTYLGVFKKNDQGYVLVGAYEAGNDIGQENLRLAPSSSSNRFSARFSFRDRKEGESLRATPTEPKFLEVDIEDQHILEVSLVGRDGVVYKNVEGESR